MEIREPYILWYLTTMTLTPSLLEAIEFQGPTQFFPVQEDPLSMDTKIQLLYKLVAAKIFVPSALDASDI